MGITCPACGLANEAGARTCRNCGLPIASAGDPVRGVVPGRVDLPKARRSGLSATIGFVMVIGLLLVGGTLAVSGGGILNSGGRLGAAAESPSAEPVGSGDPGNGDGAIPRASGDPESGEVTPTDPPANLTTSTDFTCEDAAIKDLSRGKWFLSGVAAGVRDETDQVYWSMTRQDGKAKKGTTVTMEWMTPRDAQRKYDVPKVTGKRALVITFDGPVDITADATILLAQLEREGIDQIGKIQLLEGKDGKVRSFIGISSEGCAKLDSKNWSKKNKRKNGQVTLDLERF